MKNGTWSLVDLSLGKKVVGTGNRPGITKELSWIRVNNDVELLDTPGILWPKFEDNTVGLHLAFIGSINDAIIETRELALELTDFLLKHYPGVIAERYGIVEEGVNHEIISEIAKSRNFVKKGSDLDFDKAASTLIDEFRSGNLGSISLEQPNE